MIEEGATHIGVATDHVIESFRNDLWPGYKTGAGVDPRLCAQFQPLEEALAAMGVAVWPMIELEADDALASAARIAAADDAVEQVCIWTPDKDLAQCVRGDRVVQVDRRANAIRNAEGVREKFGVDPRADPRPSRAGRRLRRTAIPASPGSARSAPRGCSTGTARSRTSRRRCSATNSANWRCCSRIWRRCETDAELFATSTSCAGPAPTAELRGLGRAARRRPPGRAGRRGAARCVNRPVYANICSCMAEATILHADLDAFYASVEQRDDPRLRGRPVIVGGGVVLAASYEAKAHGVRTADERLAGARGCARRRSWSARGCRPTPRRARRSTAVFDDTSPLVEGLSIDEAFLDVRGHAADRRHARSRSPSGCGGRCSSGSACRSRSASRAPSSWPRWRAGWPSPTACWWCRPTASSRSCTRCRSSGCGGSGR